MQKVGRSLGRHNCSNDTSSTVDVYGTECAKVFWQLGYFSVYQPGVLEEAKFFGISKVIEQLEVVVEVRSPRAAAAHCGASLRLTCTDCHQYSCFTEALLYNVGHVASCLPCLWFVSVCIG